MSDYATGGSITGGAQLVGIGGGCVIQTGAPTLPTVPNSPKTPLRNFRIPENEYRPAFEKAQSEGTNLTAVVREKLREYMSEDGDE